MPVLQMFGCVHASARLAQSAERKALNLVVAGSSPTVGDNIGSALVFFRRVLLR